MEPNWSSGARFFDFLETLFSYNTTVVLLVFTGSGWSRGDQKSIKNQVCLQKTALDAGDRHGTSKLDRFLVPKPTPKEARRNEKPSSDGFKNEKSEIVDFLYPSHAKSPFLNCNGSQDGASMTPKFDFYSDSKR